MNDNERLGADMVNIFGIETIMKYFTHRAEADLKFSKTVKDCKTYVLIDRISGFYKIGKTSDVRKRVQILSCGNPNIELLLVIDSDVESELHNKFNNKLVKGEWYALSHKDIDFIRRKWCEKYTPALLKQ